MRRVVVTGLGMVSPLANGVEPTWKRILEGRSRRRANHRLRNRRSAVPDRLQVPRGDGSDGTFNADQWMEPKEQRKVDDFIIFAIAAATQALQDAGWRRRPMKSRSHSGVLIGSGIGGLGGIYETSLVLKEKGPRRVSPFFIPGR
jgi:3-oxoacyl-[acyl-carrier-protein] synthase II